MLDRNTVISAASEIENDLRQSFSTSSRMFGDIIAEIGASIPRKISDHLRVISSVRAKFAHYSDDDLIKYSMSESYLREGAEFNASVHAVREFLDKFRTPGTSTKRPLIRESAMFSEWIIKDPISAMPLAIRKPLLRDCHVVFTRRGAPHSVAPVHDGFVLAQIANFPCDGAIGIAKDFGHRLQSGNLRTSDGVDVSANVHVHLSTVAVPKENLLRIAREHQSILQTIRDSSDAVCKKWARRFTFDEITDSSQHDNVERELWQLVERELTWQPVVSVRAVTVVEIAALSPSIKTHNRISFDRSRQRLEEDERARVQMLALEQERLAREMAREERLDDAKVESAILSIRAEAKREAGEWGLSSDQIFQLIVEKIRSETKVSVAKAGREQWKALGYMAAMESMNFGDNRIRIINEPEADPYDEEDEDKG